MTHLHKRGAAALITAAILALVLLFTGCPNNAGGSGSGSATPPVPPEIVYEFVEISEVTIVGVALTTTYPEMKLGGKAYSVQAER